jgi:enterobactin synthetase component D
MQRHHAPSCPALLPAQGPECVLAARVANCRIDRLVSATSDGQPQEGVAIRCDTAAFDPSLYQVFGIARPDTIARSVMKRQAEFFHGRLAAGLALAAQRAMYADIPIGPSREPVWPAGWVGSISHTTGVASAIVAPADALLCRAIGLDAERIAEGEAIDAILRHALNPHEAALLTAAFPDDPTVAITIGFSAKESLYKASFADVGRFFDFNAAEVTAVDTALGMVDLVMVERLGEHIPKGMRWRIRYGRPIEGIVVTHASLARKTMEDSKP